VGSGALHRAVVLGAAGVVLGALVFGLVLGLVTRSSGTVVVAGMIGGAVLLGAVGALWGAFSRLGRNPDWREAMPDHPPTPDIDLRDPIPASPETRPPRKTPGPPRAWSSGEP
jgi:hypothetical protein